MVLTKWSGGAGLCNHFVSILNFFLCLYGHVCPPFSYFFIFLHSFCVINFK